VGVQFAYLVPRPCHNGSVGARAEASAPGSGSVRIEASGAPPLTNVEERIREPYCGEKCDWRGQGPTQ